MGPAPCAPQSLAKCWLCCPSWTMTSQPCLSGWALGPTECPAPINQSGVVGPFQTKHPTMSRFAPAADWRGKPVHPGQQIRLSPPNCTNWRNCCSLVVNLDCGLAASRALMGVGELIYAIWGARMDGCSKPFSRPRDAA